MAAPVVSSCDVSALGYCVRETLDSGRGFIRQVLECTRRQHVHGAPRKFCFGRHTHLFHSVDGAFF